MEMGPHRSGAERSHAAGAWQHSPAAPRPCQLPWERGARQQAPAGEGGWVGLQVAAGVVSAMSAGHWDPSVPLEAFAGLPQPPSRHLGAFSEVAFVRDQPYCRFCDSLGLVRWWAFRRPGLQMVFVRTYLIYWICREFLKSLPTSWGGSESELPSCSTSPQNKMCETFTMIPSSCITCSSTILKWILFIVDRSMHLFASAGHHVLLACGVLPQTWVRIPRS